MSSRSSSRSSDEVYYKKKRHRSASNSPKRYKRHKHKVKKEKRRYEDESDYSGDDRHHRDHSDDGRQRDHRDSDLENRHHHKRHHRDRRKMESPHTAGRWEDEERRYDDEDHDPIRVKREAGDRSHHHRHNRGSHRDQDSSRRRQHEERAYHDRRREETRQQRDELPSEDADPEADTQPKETPNFGLSGKLTEETNTFRGVVIKYSEPQEARKPKRRWRFYPFKGDEPMPVLHISRQSAYLLGRDRKIADIPVDHPSCSKQHAVLQYRLVDYEREDGFQGRQVRPYIIDLESANGTFVNSKKVDPRRYVELREKDVLKFGFSTREYVLLHDKSDTTEVDLGVD